MRDIVSFALIPLLLLLLLLLLHSSCSPRCVRCQAAVAVAAEGEDEDYFGDELSDEALIALITQVCTQTATATDSPDRTAPSRRLTHADPSLAPSPHHTGMHTLPQPQTRLTAPHHPYYVQLHTLHPTLKACETSPRTTLLPVALTSPYVITSDGARRRRRPRRRPCRDNR